MSRFIEKRNALLIFMVLFAVGGASFQYGRYLSFAHQGGVVDEQDAERSSATPPNIQRARRQFTAIRDRIAAQGGSGTELLEQVLNFVHDHSVHEMNERNSRHGIHVPTVIDQMVRVMEGEDTERPALTCGPRAMIMSIILQQFQIDSRIIQIYSDSYDTVQSHRLLEVFNPETRQWEMWDPDYRVAYIDRRTGRGVDSISLIQGEKENFAPRNGELVGWEVTAEQHGRSLTRVRDNYFKAVMFENSARGMSYPIIFIGKDFDRQKRFQNGLTFEEWSQKNYKQPRFIGAGRKLYR
ncbi:hypothetical protein MRY87_02310 [bacterium]|nr:hypothetical protein [bacterium]